MTEYYRNDTASNSSVFNLTNCTILCNVSVNASARNLKKRKANNNNKEPKVCEQLDDACEKPFNCWS